MERSSPIAAMRSQAIPFGTLQWNYALGERISQARNDFGFQDFRSNSTYGDYLTSRPSRATSPTSNLAADLSRNFHLDSSPLPPTPRRSLFSCIGSNVQAATPSLVTTFASQTDSMDISPLPHKAPFSAVVTVQAATPIQSPSEQSETILSSPMIMPDSPLVTLRSNSANDRRRVMTRPSLTRAKGFSTSSIGGCKSAGLIAPPPFRFGNNISLPRQASLDEGFVESPQEMSFSAPFRSAFGRRPQSSHQKTLSFAETANDAFLAPFPVKKFVARPRKLVRRSLSMYEHPVDVFNQQEQNLYVNTNEVPTAMDLDTGSRLQLPHFFSDEDDALPRIKKRTITDILDGKYSSVYDEIMVIDCRFEYEYNGGHINGAINFNDKEELATRLFDRTVNPKTLLIFHCEYSAHRAPIAAKYVRGEDRNANAHQYPKLSYPEIYILDGGYSSFYKEYKHRCFPQNYVEMNDKRYTSACERGMDRLPIPRTKLYRAATFTFGVKKVSQESPCGPPRILRTSMGTGIDMSMDVDMDYGMDSSPMTQRGSDRRMVSY